MSWSYMNPLSSRKDEVRFLIGDTNSDLDEQMLQDEEINYVLTVYPVASDLIMDGKIIAIDRRSQPLMAALVCAEAIWMYMSRQADEGLPPVNIDYAKRAANYKRVIDDLRIKLYTRGGVIPYAGGISVEDKRENVLDADRVKPFMYRREMDNRGTITGETDNLLGIE